jgi:hypothetical protein
MLKAVALDEAAEIDKPQDLGIIAEPETETPTPAEPVAPPKIEMPVSDSPVEKIEKSLAERWREVQDTAKKHKIAVKDILSELKIKEVKPENIDHIETVLNEKVDQTSGSAQE